MRIATDAERPRNGMVFTRGAVQDRRADRGARLYEGLQGVQRRRAAGAGDRKGRPYGRVQKVRYSGPMWGTNRALPVAEEAR